MRLTDAIRLACEAHDGQKDQNGEAYIRHCVRVMEALGPDEEAMVVGVLHDLLEDTHVALSSDQFIWAQWTALGLLTRSEGQSYEDYIDRICSEQSAAGRLARNVKRADLNDNLSLGRMDRLRESKRTVLRGRYRAALDAIQVIRKHRDLPSGPA